MHVAKEPWKLAISTRSAVAHTAMAASELPIDLSNVYKITVQRAIFTAQHVRVRRFGSEQSTRHTHERSKWHRPQARFWKGLYTFFV